MEFVGLVCLMNWRRTMNNIAIIGAGPAGVSAAVQLRRYGFAVDIFERNIVGGLARNANLIENLIENKHSPRQSPQSLRSILPRIIYFA